MDVEDDRPKQHQPPEQLLQALPDDVRSRLRSGVTITNAAQCVEELVLNAVDAGATCIAVRLDLRCGKIQVVDNGCGMSSWELERVAERYTTSKCHSILDLDENLQHYGYRGEALASIRDIASVLDIQSRAVQASHSYSRTFQKDTAHEVIECVVQRPSSGTTVTIHDLFHRLPVRKKCLNETIEIERIRQRIEALALINPTISVSLRNDATSYKLLQTHKSSSVLSTFADLFGSAKARNMCCVSCGDTIFSVNGHIGKEGHHNKNLQFIFVNERLVLKTKLHRMINFFLSRSSISRKRQDNSPQWGSGSSFSPQRSYGERHGIYVMNIACKLSDYDITFDPSKTLIVFKEWRRLAVIVENMVKEFLKKEELVNSKDGDENFVDDVEGLLGQDMEEEGDEENDEKEEAKGDMKHVGKHITSLQKYAAGITTVNSSNNLTSKTVSRAKIIDTEKIVEEIVAQKCQQDILTKLTQKAQDLNVCDIQASPVVALDCVCASPSREEAAREKGSPPPAIDSDIEVDSPPCNVQYNSLKDVPLTHERESSQKELIVLSGPPSITRRFTDIRSKLRDSKADSRHGTCTSLSGDSSDGSNAIQHGLTPLIKLKSKFLAHSSSKTSKEDSTSKDVLGLNTSSNIFEKLKSKCRKRKTSNALVVDGLHSMPASECPAKCDDKNSNEPQSSIIELHEKGGSSIFPANLKTAPKPMHGRMEDSSDQSVLEKKALIGLKRIRKSLAKNILSESLNPKEVEQDDGMMNCMLQVDGEREITEPLVMKPHVVTRAIQNQAVDDGTFSNRAQEGSANGVCSGQVETAEPHPEPNCNLDPSLEKPQLEDSAPSAPPSNTEIQDGNRSANSHFLLENYVLPLSMPFEDSSKQARKRSAFGPSNFQLAAKLSRMSKGCLPGEPEEKVFSLVDMMLDNTQEALKTKSYLASSCIKYDRASTSDYYDAGTIKSYNIQDHNKEAKATDEIPEKYRLLGTGSETFSLYQSPPQSSLNPTDTEIEKPQEDCSLEEYRQCLFEKPHNLLHSSPMSHAMHYSSLLNRTGKNIFVGDDTPKMAQKGQLEDAYLVALSPKTLYSNRPGEVASTLNNALVPDNIPALIQTRENKTPSNESRFSPSIRSLSAENYSTHSTELLLMDTSNDPRHQSEAMVRQETADDKDTPSQKDVFTASPLPRSENITTRSHFADESRGVTVTPEPLPELEPQGSHNVPSESTAPSNTCLDECEDPGFNNQTNVGSLDVRESENVTLLENTDVGNVLCKPEDREKHEGQETLSLSIIELPLRKFTSKENFKADSVQEDPSSSASDEKILFSGTWICKIDPKSGKKIFINSITGHSKYDEPLEEKELGAKLAKIRFKHPMLPTEAMHPESARCGNLNTKARDRKVCSLNTNSFLSNLYAVHLRDQGKHEDDEKNVKWRPGTLTDGTSVNDMFDNWDNPVIQSEGQTTLNIEAQSSAKGALQVQQTIHPYKLSKDIFSKIKVLGQVDNKFIACMMALNSELNGPSQMIVVIDQHAAHERVRQERLFAESFTKEGECKLKTNLKPAMTIVLKNEYVRVLNAFKKQLQKNGISLSEDISRRDALVVHSIPSCLSERDVFSRKKVSDRVLVELIEVLLETNGSCRTIPHSIIRSLNSQACHGAIKFGDPLELGECKQLIDELSLCQLPFQCAHGRPSIMPILDLDQVRLQHPTKVLSRPNISKLADRRNKETSL